MRKIALLGATGSIGTQTLQVMRAEGFQLVAFSAGYNIALTKEIIDEFKPKLVSVASKDDASALRQIYKDIKIVSGNDGLIEVSKEPTADTLVNALVGSRGLLPTVAGIRNRKKILLANKETLVIAGEIVKKLASEFGVDIIPIDSEHSAIYQTLESKSDLRRIVITASGGSFRDLSRLDLENVTKEDALRHPNWSMGEKITIDSATMMNKGLEVIEAHYLFDIPYEMIDTVLHKESIVHSLVEYQDGSMLAHIGVSDMKIPIAYALTHPRRMKLGSYLSLDKLDLSFKKMDYDRYPLLKLAYDVGKKKGLLPTVMNAANEAAVKLFLDDKISFLDIEKIVINTVENFDNIQNPTIEEIISIDKLVYNSIIKDN